MLKVDNIVTRYGTIEALKGLSLEASEGQVTCLLGPNGAGKTTTLFTITGILKRTVVASLLKRTILQICPLRALCAKGSPWCRKIV